MNMQSNILHQIGKHIGSRTIVYSDLTAKLSPGSGDDQYSQQIGEVNGKLNHYYVYEFTDDDNHRYIGKGYAGRIFDHYKDQESPIYWKLKRDECHPILLEYGLNEEEAYNSERQLIDEHRDHLINCNSGLVEPPDLSVTRKKIMGMIAGFFEMAGALPFNGRTRVRDMVSLLVFLCTGFRCGRLNGITMSQRKLAEAIGMWADPARDSLQSLMEKGIIDINRKGYCREADSYDVKIDGIFPMWSPLCTTTNIDIDYLLRVIGHDAFRQRALGKHALLVYLYCHLHPDNVFRVQHIADALGISIRVVYKCLEPLLENGLIVKEGRWYRANPFFQERKLDEIARRYRTNGIGEAAAAHFYRERSAHVASLLRNRGFECGEDGLSFLLKQVITEAQRQISLIRKIKRIFVDLQGFRLIPTSFVNAVPSYIMRC